jgi:hypothetical protein
MNIKGNMVIIYDQASKMTIFLIISFLNDIMLAKCG